MLNGEHKPKFPLKYKWQSTMMFRAKHLITLNHKHKCCIMFWGEAGGSTVGCCPSVRPFVDGGVGGGGWGSQRGGEVNQVIYQRNVWRETVEPGNRRVGKMRMWKGWRRWRGLYKSRWREIREKREPVWCRWGRRGAGVALKNRATGCVCVCVCT